VRVLVACKRGNIAKRDSSGHCTCDACKAYRAEYRRSVIDKKRAYVRTWRKANPQKVSDYSRKWRVANRKQRRDIEKSWRSRNVDKVKDMSRRGGAKWSSGNGKGRRNALTQFRRAALLQRTPSWVDREAIAEIYIKAADMRTRTGIPYEVDHEVPLQGKTISGLHVPWNLRIITESENRSKRNRFDGGVLSAF
jgi:hypothetical protein